MNYFYMLSDYVLISTINIPFLHAKMDRNIESRKIIRLNVYYKDYEDQKNNESFVIDFNCNLTYVIYKNDNLIKAYTDSDEKVISSFFNVPLSIFMLRDNSAILHASTIEINGKLFAFSGKKGSGKSTLTFLLSKNYNFFSDDTLLLRKNKDMLYAGRLIPITRLCKDTYEKITELSNFDKYQHNIAGKAYVTPKDIDFKDSSINFGELKAMFFIERISEPIFKLHKIDSSIIKHLNVAGNIVGIDYIRDGWLLEECTKELLDSIVDNVIMFKLFIPDDFEYVRSNFIEFMKKILEI